LPVFLTEFQQADEAIHNTGRNLARRQKSAASGGDIRIRTVQKTSSEAKSSFNKVETGSLRIYLKHHNRKKQIMEVGHFNKHAPVQNC
jgi:hypothetical protein